MRRAVSDGARARVRPAPAKRGRAAPAAAALLLAACASASAQEVAIPVESPRHEPDSERWDRSDCDVLAYHARIGTAPGRGTWLATRDRVGCDDAWELPARATGEAEAAWLARVAATAPDRGWRRPWMAPDVSAVLSEAGDAGLVAVLRWGARTAERPAEVALPQGFAHVRYRDDLVARVVLEDLASSDPAERASAVRLAGLVRPVSASAPSIVRALAALPADPPQEVMRRCGGGILGGRKAPSRLRLLWGPAAGGLPFDPAELAMSRLAEDEELIALVRHPDAPVARRAIHVLASRPGGPALQALAMAAGDERLASDALAVLEGWSVTCDVRPALRPALSAGSPPLRLTVAGALARCGAPEGLDALVQLAAGGDVAATAANELTQLVGPKPADLDWTAWWAVERPEFDIGLHHARRLVAFAALDRDDGVETSPRPDARVLAAACTAACVPLVEIAASAASEEGRALVETFLGAWRERWRSPAPRGAGWEAPVRAVLREGSLDEVEEALKARPSLPPALVRAALLRIADDGWEAELVLVRNSGYVGCEELDAFEGALEDDDVEDLGSEYIELRAGLRCD